MDVVAVVLMVAALGLAVWRPRGLSEAAVAVPAAVAAVVLGVVEPDRAWDELRELSSTVLFLAALLVISFACSALGVFDWVARLIAHRAASPGGAGHPTGHRLFGLVFAAAAITTAALSLDATVLLLTPVLLSMTSALRVPARPHSYATVTLANSASTLMPVSNLTNLLAFAATGLGFVEFTALMALPWLVTLIVEFGLFCWYFRTDLAVAPGPDVLDEPGPAPRAPLIVLAATLAAFGVSSLVGIEPVWCAVAGAVAMASLAWRGRTCGVRALAMSAQPGFLLFVCALGVLVAGISDGAIGGRLADLLPDGTGLLDLLIVAGVAAIAANVINNIPATLLMLAALGGGAPAALILAMLLGVNIGPSLTYLGSLANLLWRNLVSKQGHPVKVAEFTAVGLVTVPLTLVSSVVALWLVT
ncbi:SLC13 family permease [Williamsia sp.]|uniref:SLC13 family permease n=1 Tax=Williamsia sp. TaxID=1872085 RepID=UPI002F93B58A